MKRNDLTEIKQLNTEVLKKKVIDAKKELNDLIMDKNISKLKDLKAISKKKKDIAQISTIVRQKELLEKLEAQAKGA